MNELTAISRRLNEEVDLAAFAGDDGVLWARGRTGLAGRGEVMRIDVPRGDPGTAAKAVHDALDAIRIDDAVGVPGSGPVAIGALPFDPARPGTLVVPELVVGRAEDGTRWVTSIGTSGGEPAVPSEVATSHRSPTQFRVESEDRKSVV